LGQQPLPLAGTMSGYPTTNTLACGARDLTSVSKAATRSPTWWTMDTSSSTPLTVWCDRQLQPTLVAPQGVTEAQLATTDEKPRSLPPMPSDTSEVDGPSADSWAGIPDPWDASRSLVEAPRQLTSSTATPRDLATIVG